MSQELSLLEGACFSLRIVVMDYYISKPIMDVDPTFSSTRSHVVKNVPILRVFGTTPAGQKCCLHLHGIFPYLYVPVPDNPPENFKSKLSLSLDRALNMTIDSSDLKVPHIFKVQEVSGIPFYGYHPREHRFLKIFFYNPQNVKKAADILQNGGVMGMNLQPHESHIPFTLQFMMDYNLQGMNFIHFSNVRFRRNKLSDEEILGKLNTNDSQSSLLCSDSESSRIWKDNSNLLQRTFDCDKLPEFLLMDEKVEKESVCELEIDAVSTDILNSNKGEGRMNPGLEAIWEDEKVRRSLLHLNESLTLPSSPPRDNACLQTDSELFWRERFKEKLDKIKEDQSLFVSETGESSSSDPNATCNLPDRSLSPSSRKIDAYPSETPDDLELPQASLVESHIESLALNSGSQITIVGRSSEDSEELDPTLFDETIIDEDVVFSQKFSQEESDRLVENDLVDLLTELGNLRGNRNDSPKPSTSAAAIEQDVLNVSELKRAQELQDEAESLEMSQIFDASDDFQKVVETLDLEKEKDASTNMTQEDEAENIWSDDDTNASFWENISLSQSQK